MTLTDYMCKEKQEEDNLLALKTVLVHQYNDLKTTSKGVEKDWLQPFEQFWQREDEQNDNNQKTKIGRKTTVWTF